MDEHGPDLSLLISAVERAEETGDLNQALLCCMEIRKLFPRAPVGYTTTASTLRRLHRIKEADVVLREGISEFPDDVAIAEQFAWLAQHCNDWSEAHIRWTSFRHRFPQVIMGYAADAVSLRQLRRFDEAERLYAELFARWPQSSNFDILADYAELAQSRGDVIEASLRWSDLRARFPNQSKSFLRDAANLGAVGRYGDAEALLREAARLFPSEPGAHVESAYLAKRRGAVQSALKRWEMVLKAFPELIDGYLGACNALIDLRRFTDARNVLYPALQLFPESVAVADLNARLAFFMSDFAGSARLWDDLRRRHPAHSVGYAGLIESLIATEKYSEADELSEKARSLFPNDICLLAAWCLIPESTRNGIEAEARWSFTYERFSEEPHVSSGYARVLAANEKWKEAEDVLTAAMRKKRDNCDLFCSYAQCATEREDWIQAESRWKKVISLFPESPAGVHGLGDMLRGAGRLDESAKVFVEGLEKFANNQDLEQGLAWTHTYRRDWREALNLWEELSRKYPGNKSVNSGTTEALWQARQDLELARNEGSQVSFEIPAGLLSLVEGGNKEHEGLKKLLLQFESLGDTCEFGMVQRKYGADPLGLLKWATTSPEQLVAALDARLAGVGEEQYTVVEALRGEYISRDKRYFMQSHTFTPSTAEALEPFTKRHLRRLQFLRRKLIEDLQAASKIFVYIFDLGISEQNARLILNAARRYNDKVSMLFVNVTQDKRLLGRIQIVDRGLYMGLIDRYSTVDINYDAWVVLCRKAYGFWSAEQEGRKAS